MRFTDELLVNKDNNKVFVCVCMRVCVQRKKRELQGYVKRIIGMVKEERKRLHNSTQLEMSSRGGTFLKFRVEQVGIIKAKARGS